MSTAVAEGGTATPDGLIHRAHRIEVEAPAEHLFKLVADVTRWPVVFAPTVHIDLSWRNDDSERFRIWATVNGRVSSWTSVRELDHNELRVAFRQERSEPPVAAMGGEWSFRELGPQRCEVTLRHRFAAVDGDSEAESWISAALDRNSDAELAALRRIAESGHAPSALIMEFEDSVTTTGRAADVFEFIRRGDLWAERLPHVREALMTEDEAGVQELTMVTETADGATHTTSSTRLCLPGNSMVYKQHVLPRLLLGHSGRWECTDTESGAVITARHMVAIDPGAIADVLGPDRELADARTYVRDALGGNSRTTLGRACAHAEQFAVDRAAAPEQR